MASAFFQTPLWGERIYTLARTFWYKEPEPKPTPPKMQIFTGRGSMTVMTWEACIYQFERTASRRKLENRKQVCSLLDCLADVALEYSRKVNTNDDSNALRQAALQ